MIQKFAAKVLSFYEVRNTRVTEYLHWDKKTIFMCYKHEEREPTIILYNAPKIITAYNSATKVTY